MQKLSTVTARPKFTFVFVHWSIYTTKLNCFSTHHLKHNTIWLYSTTLPYYKELLPIIVSLRSVPVVYIHLIISCSVGSNISGLDWSANHHHSHNQFLLLPYYAKLHAPLLHLLRASNVITLDIHWGHARRISYTLSSSDPPGIKGKNWHQSQSNPTTISPNGNLAILSFATSRWSSLARTTT